MTSCETNNVVYVNRSDREPWYRPVTANTATTFTTLSDFDSGDGNVQFDSTYRFKSMRAVNNLLVGINVVKGSVSLPKTVLWSDFTTYGFPPNNWDVASTETSAGETTLAELKGELVDGAVLNNNMILYGDKETWIMEFVSGPFIFNFRRIFSSGIMNVNCVAEHDNRHYVFGNDDIYVTDGLGRESVAMGRVRKFIFNNIDYSKRYLCFVVKNSAANEVMFCYPSLDAYCAFPLGAPLDNVGCNRAAVYNYSSNTWSFYDLPYVTYATRADVVQGRTWAEADEPWGTGGGSWAALDGNTNDLLVMCSKAHTVPLALSGAGATEPLDVGPWLRTLEPYDSPIASFPIDLPATAKAVLLHPQMDLDELGAPIRGDKLISSITPQVDFASGAGNMVWTVGSSYLATEQPTYTETQTFGPTDDKLDFHTSGRYLSIRIDYDDFRKFSISAMDVEITALGVR